MNNNPAIVYLQFIHVNLLFYVFMLFANADLFVSYGGGWPRLPNTNDVANESLKNIIVKTR